MCELSDWVVVFDLDDTLYYEDDYSLSGVRAVASELSRLYKMDITDQLLDVRREQGDIWGHACELLSLPTTVKDSLLWMYRLHQPQIDLGHEVVKIVADLADKVQQVAILTDGRSVTQRLKLEALGLLEYPLYISEEYNSMKPKIDRFQVIMSDFPAEQYTYIADNPVKDFVSPNSLSWRTIGLSDNGRNVHPQNIDRLQDAYLPDVWVDKFDEIVDNLC